MWWPVASLLWVSASVALLGIASAASVVLRRSLAAAAAAEFGGEFGEEAAFFFARGELARRAAVGARTACCAGRGTASSAAVVAVGCAAGAGRAVLLLELLLLQSARHGFVAFYAGAGARGGTAAIGVVAGKGGGAFLRVGGGFGALVDVGGGSAFGGWHWTAFLRVGGLGGLFPRRLFGHRVGVEPRLVLLVPDRFPAGGELGWWWALGRWECMVSFVVAGGGGACCAATAALWVLDFVLCAVRCSGVVTRVSDC